MRPCQTAYLLRLSACLIRQAGSRNRHLATDDGPGFPVEGRWKEEMEGSRTASSSGGKRTRLEEAASSVGPSLSLTLLKDSLSLSSDIEIGDRSG